MIDIITASCRAITVPLLQQLNYLQQNKYEWSMYGTLSIMKKKLNIIIKLNNQINYDSKK